MKLHGARAVVTGGSSGIGRAVAHRLAAAGCQVTVCGRDQTRLREVAVDVGGEAVVADVATAAGVEHLIEQVTHGPVPDLVVHNAGIGYAAAAAEVSDERLHEVMSVNVLAPIRLTRALLPRMLSRGGGRLVFVGSIAGVLGVSNESVYAASKAALDVYAASLRAELASGGVGVTTVVPGVVDTEFFTRRGVAYDRRMPRPIAAGRVAKAVVRGVERDRAQVVVPSWLRVAMAIRACAPQTYARLATRLG